MERVFDSGIYHDSFRNPDNRTLTSHRSNQSVNEKSRQLQHRFVVMDAEGAVMVFDVFFFAFLLVVYLIFFHLLVSFFVHVVFSHNLSVIDNIRYVLVGKIVAWTKYLDYCCCC